MSKQIERRTITAGELRVDDGADAPKIVGYAAVFNSRSVDLGGFTETIAPGAFARTLKEKADVRALVDHDPSRIIGRTKAGTLSLREDKSGLLAEITPPDTSTGRDVLESIRRGDISQMSFGFITRSDAWEENDGEFTRELRDVDLFDVSTVTFPAYEQTQVAVRSLEQWTKRAKSVMAVQVLRMARAKLWLSGQKSID